MKKKKQRIGVWILPALVSMSVIQFLPGFVSVLMGFTNLGVQNITNIANTKFVGLRNFIGIFKKGTVTGNQFMISLFGTLEYTFLATAVTFLFGLGLALLLNQDFRGKAFVRAALIVPWIVPGVVAAFIWRLMFLSDYGVINKLLRHAGLIKENIFWLLEDKALMSLVIAHLWSNLPFVMISILAALQTISEELYEACKIDGGNVFQRFLYITVPGIKNVSVMIVLLSFIKGAGEFTLPYVMYGRSAPPGKANLISILVYQTSFQTWEFGQGAAMSCVVLVIMLLLAILYMRLAMQEEKE